MFAHLERRAAGWPDVTGDLTLEWCWSPIRRKDGTLCEPSLNTARNRQRTARAAFTQAAKLGAQVDPDAAAGDRIKRADPDVPTRPLSDRQLQRVCAVAEAGTAASKKPVLAAEAAAVRAQDIDLAAGTVTLLGPCKRVCALDEWSVRAIARYLRANPDTAPHERLCVKADTPPQAAVQSVSIRLWKIIKQAGLASRGGISPGSIRLAAARGVLECDGIIAATRFLGSASLDNTAEALGHDWQQPTAVPAGQASSGDD